MDQNTVFRLTQDYVGQVASTMGFWISADSREKIAAHVMSAVTQGVIKAFREKADAGVEINNQVQI